MNRQTLSNNWPQAARPAGGVVVVVVVVVGVVVVGCMVSLLVGFVVW
jgi:hypothetical protein